MRFSAFILFAANFTAFVVASTSFVDCLTSANISAIYNSSKSWPNETTPYNLRFSWQPAAVVIPEAVSQVSAVVKCAASMGTKVTARSGGHSYASYSLGGEDGHLIIDLRRFQQILLDNQTHVATVGAGVRLGNLAQRLYTLGHRGLPHGTCPSVGIGGHATFGGFGLYSRLWGLTVDMLTEMTAVLADGTIIKASPSVNSDLFWALAGAAPSYAVVTEFKLKTLQALEENIVWTYDYKFTTPTTAACAFLAMQNWGLNSAPKELGYGMLLGDNGRLTIRGVFNGRIDALQRLIEPLLVKLKTLNTTQTPITTIKSLGWLDHLQDLSGAPSLTVPITGTHEYATFYAKSFTTENNKPLTLGALTSMFNHASGTRNFSWMLIANLYGGARSAINELPSSDSSKSQSSYGHRNAGYVMQVYGMTPDNRLPWDEDIIPFVEEMVNSLGDEAKDLMAYAPYVDPELRRQEAQRRYWGDGVTRLRKLKLLYDPDDVFHWPQGF